MLFFLCKNWFSFIPCQTLHYCCLRSSLVCFNKICSLYFLSSTLINRRMFQRANIISKYGGEMCIWEQLKSNSHLFFLIVGNLRQVLLITLRQLIASSSSQEQLLCRSTNEKTKLFCFWKYKNENYETCLF